MNTPQALSSLLTADERGDQVKQPKRCCHCGEAYDPATGNVVEKPFIWINAGLGICRPCTPKRIAA